MSSQDTQNNTGFWVQALERFLIKHGCYNEFHGYSGYRSLKEYFENTPVLQKEPQTCIVRAFSWMDSSHRGFAFWSALSNKWAERVKELQNADFNPGTKLEKRVGYSCEAELPKCTCGAAHTSNPNFHTDWCDIRA